MKMDNFFNITTTIMLGITIGIVLCLFVWILPMKDKVRSLEKGKSYMDTTYLRKQGYTSTYKNNSGRSINKPDSTDDKGINYDLRSWDGGKNWYAVKYDFETKELKIIGDAEMLYPKLLQHLDAWDKLENHVKKNGPINPSDSEGLKVLEGAGFTVKHKN